MTGDPPRGTCFLLVLESFRGNARNNQPLYCLQQRWSTWTLAIAYRKQFGLVNFWQMWDTYKKDRHPSCATSKCIANAKNPTHHSRTKYIHV